MIRLPASESGTRLGLRISDIDPAVERVFDPEEGRESGRAKVGTVLTRTADHGLIFISKIHIKITERWGDAHLSWEEP